MIPNIIKTDSITLKLYGTGVRYILNPYLEICPNAIYLNGRRENIMYPYNCLLATINYVYSNKNYIKLIFK